MTHFLVIIIFALIVGVVFGVIGREGRDEQIKYGAGVFLKFVAVALVLGWLLYFLPI